ncbi:unnamed protein product, partial [Brassica rapa subsp. trilocularis]
MDSGNLLAVRPPGKDPERSVPSPSPGRHEAVRSRHVSRSSSPPTTVCGLPISTYISTLTIHISMLVLPMDCSCTDFGQLVHHVSTHISTLALSVNCSCTDLDMSSSIDGLDCPRFYPLLGGNYNSRRSERCFCRTDLANDTCLWEPELLLRVGNRAAGACVASSPDSDLEAFSHNPAHGRADIEGSKSNVAMNAWLPHSFKFRRSKGSIGHAFTIFRPSLTPHLTMSFARIDPPKRVLGLKEWDVTLPPIHRIPKEPFPVRPPANTRRSALATVAAQAAHQQSTGSELGPPSPALRANLFPEV